MVSNRKRLENKAIDIESYRRLVLTHLYVLCRSRCVPLKRLGEDELRAAGARIVRNEFGVREIEVDIPPEKERELRAELLRVQLAGMKEFLPDKVKKKKNNGFVRGKKRPGSLANAQTMDEGLMDSCGSSVQPKDRF